MDEYSPRGVAGWAITILAYALLLLGLAMSLGGAYLIYLGGTLYFFLAGIGTLAAAVMLLLGLPGGVWLYGVVVAATFAWSLWEIAVKGWMPIWHLDLMARTGFMAVLLAIALFLLPALYRRGYYQPALPYAGPLLGVVILAGYAGTAVWLVIDSGPANPATAVTEDSHQSSAPDSTDWVAYGGSNLAQRFSIADQITPHADAHGECQGQCHDHAPVTDAAQGVFPYQNLPRPTLSSRHQRSSFYVVVHGALTIAGHVSQSMSHFLRGGDVAKDRARRGRHTEGLTRRDPEAPQLIRWKPPSRFPPCRGTPTAKEST